MPRGIRMASAARMLVLALAALAVSARGTAAAAAPSYPICPHTGKLPTAPRVPPTRCLSAAKLSCCDTCEDFLISLQQNAVNATRLLIAVAPSLVPQLSNSVLSKDYQSCDVTGKYTEGQFIVEQFICGVTCNPDSGDYFSLLPRPTVWVCKDISSAFFAAVKDVQFPGFPGRLGDFVQSNDTFTRQLFQGFAESVGLSNLQINFIDPSVRTCWNMTGRPLPATAGCCDPFVLPNGCPADLVNVTANPSYKKVLNRTIPSFCSPAAAPGPAPSAGTTGGGGSSGTKSAGRLVVGGVGGGRGRSVAGFAAAAFAQLGGSFLLIPVVAGAVSSSSSSLLMWMVASLAVSWLLLAPV